MAINKDVTLTTDIILIEIVKFSQIEIQKQLEIMKYITMTYKKMLENMLRNSNTTVSKLILGSIPTDNGFFFILNPRIQGYGAILGLSFLHLSGEISKNFHYFEGTKIAVHNAKIYTFKDILGLTNFIGEGINDCAQYLDFKDYSTSTIMVSKSAFTSLKKFLTLHKDYNSLLNQQEFKYSQEYTFHDTHQKEKTGTLIWLQKSGIINPPNTNFNSMI